MTTTASPAYTAPAAMTITLANLASDTNLLVGRESLAVDQKDVSDAVDVLVGGKITTGTTPTAARQIEVWVSGSWDDAEFLGGCTGADAGLTVTAETKVNMKLAAVLPTNGTSNVAYTFLVSLARLFGGAIPVQWSVFVVHNTGVALKNAGADQEIYYTPIKYESA